MPQFLVEIEVFSAPKARKMYDAGGKDHPLLAYGYSLSAMLVSVYAKIFLHLPLPSFCSLA